ncbi:hypothetical protein BDV96DRAFT_266959 [Lophiotrema nucula]|uniref:Uncharacterized protein n=1 Tax=Lophiotrema nucula TaxID=690887 RepID=A0A6A5ZM51_9PLEO|nr:hypothetical protein BDV96DRAFT_266959 [Lophiotrema nucula]
MFSSLEVILIPGQFDPRLYLPKLLNCLTSITLKGRPHYINCVAQSELVPCAETILTISSHCSHLRHWAYRPTYRHQSFNSAEQIEAFVAALVCLVLCCGRLEDLIIYTEAIRFSKDKGGRARYCGMRENIINLLSLDDSKDEAQALRVEKWTRDMLVRVNEGKDKIIEKLE